jgi:hypothetical protein
LFDFSPTLNTKKIEKSKKSKKFTKKFTKKTFDGLVLFRLFPFLTLLLKKNTTFPCKTSPSIFSRFRVIFFPLLSLLFSPVFFFSLRVMSRACLSVLSLVTLLALLALPVLTAPVPPAKTLVKSLPDWGTLRLPQTTGFLNVANNSHPAYLFYWYVPSLNSPAHDPLIIWLSGGPGCSSELSYFYEIGPFRVVGTGAPGNTTLEFAPYTWARNASLLFIDSPVGTGFSYLANPLAGGYATNEQEVADALYAFLNQWFPLFPIHFGAPFYISAESYGGHYAPALGTRINQGNTDNNPATLYMNLQGMSIGNGMTDPFHQVWFLLLSLSLSLSLSLLLLSFFFDYWTVFSLLISFFLSLVGWLVCEWGK